MTLYRKPAPYRKPQTYRGAETALPVVPPGFFGGTATPWRDADDHYADTTLRWAQAPARGHAVETPWERLDPVGKAIAQAWRQARTHDADTTMPWGQADKYFAHNRHPWTQAKPHDVQVTTPWQQFVHKLAAHIGLPWIVPRAHQTDAALAWGTLAQRSAATSNLWRQLAKLGAHIALPWGAGHHFQNGYIDPWHAPPVDPTIPLEFPDLPVYIMIPSMTAVVIDGGADLKPLAITFSGDVDSYDWSCEVQIPAETFHLVNPETHTDDPVAIRVSVNGTIASFIIDDFANNRRWGARGYSIRGGSRSRILGEDFGPARTLLQTDDYNAAQLADHEVESTGWTVLWDTVDWLVPGGNFTYQDLTPIAALQQLAASVGATLESDLDALEIHVRPRYPLKPWEWDSATPYAIVPAALLDTAGGQWAKGNNADGIYIYPQNATSGAFVQITGTGGIKLLPMKVDPLLVDAGAQTERGVQELAAAGRKTRIQTTIPLFPAPAVPSFIPLRELLQVTDESGETYIAQVMANSIGATRSGGKVSARQTLTLERQFR